MMWYADDVNDVYESRMIHMFLLLLIDILVHLN